ncbi:MAG: lamin tail domain-containing protein, partial [Proteobacteria bacterium]|nr:lamin tail domain-containing protein [Pseudomonadota bacterium]
MARLLLLVGFSALAVAGCTNDSQPTSPPGSGISATPVRLNEIRFLPSDDAPVFVELVNFGAATIDLDGASLRTEAGAIVNLPQDLRLEPGALFVVNFDDQQGSGDGILHVPAADFAVGESGGVWLDLPDGVADAVLWGKPDLASVDLCRGGRCAAAAAGSVLARLPNVTDALAPAAWAPLDPAHATPAQDNLRPAVAAFAALPGMIFTGRPHFSWYSVPGAARYLLQVASDENFASVVHEEQVEATPGMRLEQLAVQGPELPSGAYVWRVQALAATGEAAEFSEPMPFSVDPLRSVPSAASASAEQEASAADQEGAAVPPPEGLLKVLDVPIIKHAKDTRMLALEAQSEHPPGSWDTPHTAGYPYCARAGVAMVNAFYRGKISQDRIGYEAYRDLRDGPEYDLPIVGINDHRTTRYSLPLALGTSGQYVTNRNNGFDVGACLDYSSDLALEQCASQCSDERSGECSSCRIAREVEIPCPAEIAYAWGRQLQVDIQREIDAERPLIATTPAHLFLIVGYRLQDDKFSFFYQDEGGRQEIQANASGFTRELESYWTGLAPVNVRSDEPEVSNDADGDGIVDFDEILRFHTSASQADSDGDGIGDKEEIRASVWDPQHGYHRTVEQLSPEALPETAAANATLGGRDFDRDGIAMERDVDSDGGGCRDGAEDKNFNGVRDGNETYNFDGEDDDCEVVLGGRIEMRYGFVPGRPPSCKGTVDIRLRFELEPDWGAVPEDSRPAVAMAYQARTAQYEISSAGCAEVIGGAGYWGGSPRLCNAPADRKSGG